jgi:hypothetical protein
VPWLGEPRTRRTGSAPTGSSTSWAARQSDAVAAVPRRLPLVLARAVDAERCSRAPVARLLAGGQSPPFTSQPERGFLIVGRRRSRPRRPGTVSGVEKMYLAECFWPDVSESKVTAVARRIAADGEAVCMELILVQADEIVLGLFQAPTPEAVTDVSRRAGLPVERVIEAVCFTPSGDRSSHPAGLVSRERAQ